MPKKIQKNINIERTHVSINKDTYAISPIVERPSVEQHWPKTLLLPIL